MSNWRRIASAPRDGTYVLLWPHWVRHKGKKRAVAAPGFWHVTSFGSAMWASPLKHPPTHWQPLPDDPEPGE